jgi:hypothetical protein
MLTELAVGLLEKINKWIQNCVYLDIEGVIAKPITVGDFLKRQTP